MEASASRSDSFSHGWFGCKARPAAFERLEGGDADASGIGHSFSSSTSFIDIDPAELFSMRWTSAAATEKEEEDVGFDFGLPCAAGSVYSSPLLVGAGRLIVSPCEPSSAVRAYGSYADVSSDSSPAFHSAQSTPVASAVSSRRVVGAVKASAEPLLATRRILLRYLRFLAPLCRKARALPLRVFAPRSRAALAAAATSSSSARQSTSSYASEAEYWCHGNADTAVRDAILYCKKSIQSQGM